MCRSAPATIIPRPDSPCGYPSRSSGRTEATPVCASGSTQGERLPRALPSTPGPPGPLLHGSNLFDQALPVRNLRQVLVIDRLDGLLEGRDVHIPLDLVLVL